MATNPVNANGGHFSQLSVPIKRATAATSELAPGISRQSQEASVTHQVDTIAALRAAIADGSYKVDSQRLAGKIIDLESQLV